MRIEREQIEAVLPHRAPVLLLEAVDITESGKRGSSILTFPENTVLWDSWSAASLKDELILEGAAQLLGVVLSTDSRPGGATEDSERLLLSFDQVDFGEPADPALPVEVSVSVVSRFGVMSAGEFVAEQQQRRLAAGKIVVLGG